jgi:hypothetical protein
MYFQMVKKARSMIETFEFFKPKHEQLDPSSMRRVPFHLVPYKLMLHDYHDRQAMSCAEWSLYPIRGCCCHLSRRGALGHLVTGLKNLIINDTIEY